MERHELIDLLSKNGVDHGRFGQGKAKSLNDLLEEVEKGETVLAEENGHLLRRIIVLNVDVFVDIEGTRRHLVEDQQIFDDGRVRRRNRSSSIAETLRSDEDALAAVPRAVWEEIQVRKFTLLTPVPATSLEKVESPSYPGLITEYSLSKVDILIPLEEYKVEGYHEREKDLVTYFVWVST